mmetsp:Transcript_99/g.238  ORF Transcript_99/g.238 Transcript_99/m.238 type:complete len:314 (-) Transcript_99:258-1199(-)
MALGTLCARSLRRAASLGAGRFQARVPGSRITWPGAGFALAETRLRSSAAVRSETTDDTFEPELIIFDKDGTLIDFKFMWGKWAHNLCDRLELAGHLDGFHMPHFNKALGYDRATGAVDSRSPLCCTPMHEIESICVDAIASLKGLERHVAQHALASVWTMPDPVADTRELTDLKLLFKFLNDDLGLKIAVCTTDDRDVTTATLRLLGVADRVDAMLCGDDRHVPPKPSPEQIFHICDQLGVDPANTIMVGDTITDMSMARRARVGMSIGIPNGAGSHEDLINHADIVLPSMNNFARLASQISGPRYRSLMSL